METRGSRLDVDFQLVIHRVLSEETEVAQTSVLQGAPDELAQACPSDTRTFETNWCGASWTMTPRGTT
jgi:hypothetical protein